ncbi:MAG: nucleotidyltransferase domain-containing protein [Nanoarchaeota archaeon]|nr:nucleotidyltransferase domain-containing protein [Nanoarchaeota archaeon]MBU1622278.1 nucleotidyltransferase domain-containing protein [Nanoarchaeota archaeon]MBU1973963.1 nucleotidyltransferase domain-containing protein [Nanoarchaeota archaeon]
MVEKTTIIKTKIFNLFRSDYLARFHVREMAKLLQKSHVTLLPHLKALEKDKVLLAKTIGKNKVYSLNFENIITKNYLTISETVETIIFLEQIFLIKKITTEIFNLNLRGTIILFGSYAKKTFKEESDIDIFYLGQITNQKIEEIKKIGKTYGKTINVKKSTLNNFETGLRKKDPLIIEIIKNHVLLQNFEQFVNALWRHFDGKR